jgi:2-oxoglutarate ferredoxin oxidoreductase subunit beta
MSNAADFKNGIKPNWCPGCGHFGIQNAIQQAVANAGLKPHQLSIVSGIGCSGRISGYLYAYGFHALHGRALPVAQGIKMGNRDLKVIACSGDGDAFAIGLGHTIHAIRRNMDITYIVMDNHVYGLTKGQTSPRSDIGFQTKSTPHGAVDAPLAALETALAAGATFIAQGFSLNLTELTALIEQGMAHKGFAFINVFSPCVTFNRHNTYDWYRQNITSLSSIDGYDPGNRIQAMTTVMEHKGLVTGLVYRSDERSDYQTATAFAATPLCQAADRPETSRLQQLLDEFR